MWLLYQIAYAALLLLLGPFLLLRRGRHYVQTISGRLGGYEGAVPSRPLWIHAVSVGEVAVATTLVRALPANLPILVTTITPTGQERARSSLGDRAAVAYLPFELGVAIDRFLARFRPRALILIEGDLWPLLMRRLDSTIPICVVNGRISDHSFRRLRRLRRFVGPLYRPVSRFGMQTRLDADRLAELGVPPDRIEVAGNVKFDAPPIEPIPDLEVRLTQLAGERRILVAGSTMPGEEQAVLAAFERVGREHDAMLILAPRHPERSSQVASLLEERGLRQLRRSRLDDTVEAVDVILVDTLGELAALYGLALGAFIGGTLVNTGGHNPIEAAQHGCAVVVGPSMENFREISEVFEQARAWRRVDDEDQLAEVWAQWLAEPESARELGKRGKEVIDSNRGALERTLDLVRPLLRHGAEVEA